MNKTVLQIPISVDLRQKAEKTASSYGFSSVQEFIRVLLNQVSGRTSGIFEWEKEIKLSPRAEKRYRKMEEELIKGVNWRTANNVEEFFDQLKK